MKLASLFLVLVGWILTVSTTQAQKPFTSYFNTYANQSYDVDISYKNAKDYTLYIDALSLDRLHEKGGFMVEQNRHSDFLTALVEARSKYVEWQKTAVDNNVKEVNKAIPVKTRVDGYFHYGSNWRFQFSLTPKFEFRVMDSDEGILHLLIVRSGEMTASDNEFMTVDGVVMVFSSADEIDKFIDTISIEKVNEYANKPKTEDLFN